MLVLVELGGGVFGGCLLLIELLGDRFLSAVGEWVDWVSGVCLSPIKLLEVTLLSARGDLELDFSDDFDAIFWADISGTNEISLLLGDSGLVFSRLSS